MRSIKWLGVLAAFAGLFALAFAAFFFSTHRQSEQASAQAAGTEFAGIRARLAGANLQRSAVSLHTFHTVIFDTRGGQRIVRIAVPYSFGRLFASGGQFRWLGQLTFLDDTEFDPEPIGLPLDQLARNGPGLIADYRHASGGQFIAWVD